MIQAAVVHAVSEHRVPHQLRSPRPPRTERSDHASIGTGTSSVTRSLPNHAASIQASSRYMDGIDSPTPA